MALLQTEEDLLKKKLTDPFGGLTGLGGTVTAGAQALPGLDIGQERTRRQDMINLQAQTGQQQLGRLFGLESTGMQTGKAISRFAPIEAQRLGNLASLESELSQRGPAEARANLALQNQILQGQQGMGLSAGQLGLQGLLGYGSQEQQQAALTGYTADGGQTAAEREAAFRRSQTGTEFTEGVRQFEAGLSLTREQMGQQASQFQQSYGLDEARQNEAIRQFDVSQNQRAIEFAANNQLDVGQFMEAKRQFDAGMSLNNAQLEESIRQFNDESGRDQQRIGLQQQEIQSRNAELERRFNLDMSRFTEETEQFELQRQDSVNQWADQFGLAQDQFGQAQAQYDSDLSQRQAEFAAQHGLNTEEFELQRSMVEAGIALDDAQLEEQIRQFNIADAVQRDQFASQHGLDVDTFNEASRQFDLQQSQRESEFGRTLALQQADQQWNETFGRAQLTGTLGDEATVQELQRQFDNNRAMTEMFGGPPPVSFSGQDLQDAIESGLSEGEAGYRPEFDFNKDGSVNFSDWSFATASGRMQTIGGDNGLATSYMFTPEGPQTLAAQELGLDERQFAESASQFSQELEANQSNIAQQFNAAQQQFLSAFGGVLVDAEGTPIQKRDPLTGAMTDILSEDAVRLNAEMTQLDTVMNQTAVDFATQMGLDWDGLNNDQRVAISQGMMASMFGAGGPGSPSGGGTDWSNVLASGMSALGQVIAARAGRSPGNTGG